jgi:acyl-CoA synthetase (AMP-forming)/AMP-acid ligase II
MPDSTRTFSQLLNERAERYADEEAYTWLGDESSAIDTSLTYVELDTNARAIAALLAQEGAHGQAVLLLEPPGLSFISALFGCFHAGAIAVPAYPPDPARLRPTLLRLAGIARDCGATIALTSTAVRDFVESSSFDLPELTKLRWVTIDADWQVSAPTWRAPSQDPDSLAILQYTSGSTADPRGVMLTHANLLHNSALIYEAFGHSRESRSVLWLPPYHDMGLIGAILQPIYGAFPGTLMSSAAFLRRPARWLRAISQHRGTTAGGPNFGFDLCLKRIPAEQREGLDLSSWDLAFNGAEPARRETMDAFSDAFEPVGFRREAFYPCYGLAEGTLLVTGSDKLRSLLTIALSADELEQRRVRPAAPGERSTAVVGCGRTASDQELVIVDPETLEILPTASVGEIWVSGPSVARGYWNRPGPTRETFEASVPAKPGRRFLRTGDLGFLHDGQLFVTGRLKDLILVRGRNYYPHEIELAAELSHPALRTNCSIAFTAAGEESEGVVVVCGVTSAVRPDDYSMIIRAIRQSVAKAAELQVNGIMLVAPRSIPKTLSGKLQRSLCQRMYESRQLEALASWRLNHERAAVASGSDLATS